MKRILIIAAKEITDNLRDRRSLFSTLFSALFTPALLIALIIVLGQSMNVNYEEQSMRLPVQGAANAPGLIDFLRENNVEIVEAPADPAAAIRDGLEDVILIIPAEYSETFRSGKPAPLQLILDSSRQSGIAARSHVFDLINHYSGFIGHLRLYARGVDPAVLSPVSIGVRDLATPQSQALIFLNMMPFFITLTVFTGGMGLIIDATAGERERGSLEPLLLNPARRAEVVLGKYLASLPFAFASLVFVLLFFWAGFRFVPIEDFIGFPMVLAASPLFQIGLLSLPVLFLASALQMVVAAFTRTFKEAQTYLAFLPVIIGLPGMFLAFSRTNPTLGKMLIPTYGQSLLINMILRGETLNPLFVTLNAGATLLTALLLVLVAIYLYRGERILFGQKS